MDRIWQLCNGLWETGEQGGRKLGGDDQSLTDLPHPLIRFTIFAMNRLDLAHLQRCDAAAWTALLRRELDISRVAVSAVSTLPVPSYPRIHRYVVSLTDHSDPITFIGKHTNRTEALFYQQVADELPDIAPGCLFSHWVGEDGWVLLADVPLHVQPDKWTAMDVETAVHGLATLHATFWERTSGLQEEGFPHFINRTVKTVQTLSRESELLSAHAVNYLGELTPAFVWAARGLNALRDLGGWPGILNDNHLEAMTDLLDDPVPMLEPLRELPATLLHGDPHTRHWRPTLFDDCRLLDWQKATIGPAVCDLVNFIEQLDWFYEANEQGQIHIRQERPLSNETIIDSYLLAMSYELGQVFNARAVRQAISAARCLYVLSNWLPRFATLFSHVPDKSTWLTVNQMSDEELSATMYKPLVIFRPYLAGIFKRFLLAYKTL